MQPVAKDYEELKALEESLWIPATRFDVKYMDSILTPDFFEFGRSGRVYRRDQTLISDHQEINIKLPLKNLQIRLLSIDIAQVTYISEVQYTELEIANRSSIWARTPTGWKLAFHQGTPTK